MVPGIGRHSAQTPGPARATSTPPSVARRALRSGHDRLARRARRPWSRWRPRSAPPGRRAACRCCRRSRRSAERGRNHRYYSTATWFVLGAVLGGATLGLGTALLGARGRAPSTSRPPTRSGSAAVLAAVSIASDLKLGGFRLPSHTRQVNEAWLDQFRSWVYGGGFGWQIGVGLATYVTTAAVYLMIAMAALTGSPAGGLRRRHRVRPRARPGRVRRPPPHHARAAVRAAPPPRGAAADRPASHRAGAGGRAGRGRRRRLGARRRASCSALVRRRRGRSCAGPARPPVRPDAPAVRTSRAASSSTRSSSVDLEVPHVGAVAAAVGDDVADLPARARAARTAGGGRCRRSRRRRWCRRRPCRQAVTRARTAPTICRGRARPCARAARAGSSTSRSPPNRSSS